MTEQDVGGPAPRLIMVPVALPRVGVKLRLGFSGSDAGVRAVAAAIDRSAGDAVSIQQLLSSIAPALSEAQVSLSEVVPESGPATRWSARDWLLALRREKRADRALLHLRAVLQGADEDDLAALLTDPEGPAIREFISDLVDAFDERREDVRADLVSLAGPVGSYALGLQDL